LLVLLGAGCFARVKPDLMSVPKVDRPAGVDSASVKPAIRVDADCEWMQVWYDDKTRVAESKVVIDLGIPIYVGGKRYVIEPAYAAECYRKILAQELEARGFRPVGPLEPADYSLRMKLVNAHYDWRFDLVLLIPIFSEEAMILAGTATFDTPAATYERNFKVVDKDAAPPPSERFRRIWRVHAARVAAAVAEQYGIDRGPN
jgi:hypothetical protein